MEEINDSNKIVESNNREPDEIEFVYNFINTPWDDRSNRSKWGIVSLLVTIFAVTMACVVNNFIMHYRGYGTIKNNTNADISCLRAKMRDYNFVARIHLVSTGDLLCIGAVVSRTSIIANGICAQSGPIRLQLGSPTKNLCKKGFSVDAIEPIYHDGVVSRTLVLLSSYENMARCVDVINVGLDLNLKAQAQIIGRSLNVGRSLSMQVATLVDKEDPNIDISIKRLNLNNLICVKNLERCPVRAGDLILQNNQLFGLAATSVHKAGRIRLACFADLKIVHRKLKELDNEIRITDYEDKGMRDV